jgi:CRISPR-associated protein Cas2
MYVIIVYDISTQRVNKVCQFLRQYLHWVQNSVFEGELTESELKKIEVEIKRMVNINEDSVIIYKFQTEKVLEKDHIGIKKAEPSFVI